MSEFSAKYKALEKEEILLKENPNRFVMLPIQYPAVWEMYDSHLKQRLFCLQMFLNPYYFMKHHHYTDNTI